MLGWWRHVCCPWHLARKQRCESGEWRWRSRPGRGNDRGLLPTQSRVGARVWVPLSLLLRVRRCECPPVRSARDRMCAVWLCGSKRPQCPHEHTRLGVDAGVWACTASCACLAEPCGIRRPRGPGCSPWGGREALGEDASPWGRTPGCCPHWFSGSSSLMPST